MEENIMDYFAMKLLQNPKREMQKDGTIKEIYSQPERLNPEDHFRDFMKMVCDSPSNAYK